MPDRRGPPTPEEEPTFSALSQAVRARREELGLRQAELADLAGCSQRFVHTVEHGKASLRLDKVLDVLEVLGLGLEVIPGRGDIRFAPESPAPPPPGAPE